MGRGYRNATDGDSESVASFAAIFTKSVHCSVGKDERITLMGARGTR